MDYIKTNWENFVTPLDETNMNHIEDGIEQLSNEQNATDVKLTEVEESINTAKQELSEQIANAYDALSDEIEAVDTIIANVSNSKLSKQNVNVLNNVNISVSGDRAYLTKTTSQLNSDNITPQQQASEQIIPDATETQSGLMTAANVIAINEMKSQIAQLQNRTTRLMYDASENPTAAQINSFVESLGYTAPFDGIAVVVDNTYHIWHYYENDNIGWKDDGVDTVNTFTNTEPGIIQGSNVEGKIFAEADGTGSVKGWDTVKQNISDNAQNITNLTQNLNTTNQNLSQTQTQVNTISQNLTSLSNQVNTIDNDLDKALVKSALEALQVVTTSNNTQTNKDINSFVLTEAQTLTTTQKNQVKANLGLSDISANYNNLTNLPTLNTNNTNAQTVSGSEQIKGMISLHKVSKTGEFSDLNNAPDSLPNPNTLTIRVNNVDTIYDGSEAKTVSVTSNPLYSVTGQNTNGAMTQAASTNTFALKEDVTALISFGQSMSYGQNTTLDWNYSHQYLLLGNIVKAGQKVGNLFTSSLNAGSYQSKSLYIQELTVVEINTANNTITFTPSKSGYNTLYNEDLYHTTDTSNTAKTQLMSRYGISQVLAGVNKSIIRRWS